MSMQDDFPKSVVLHFPPSVYQKIGASEMLPYLLESLKIEDLRCVQFLRNGKVRVSFFEKETRDRFLSEGMRFEDQEIPVTKDGQKVTVVYIRDLPYEVASDDVIDFFSSYGEVLTAERSVSAKFPNLCNGNRVLKMILNDEIPYFLSVCGCPCRVWYRGQPIQCFVCRALGHRAQDCPLSGRCRYCHQVGHMARECAQAWDPLPAVVNADDSCMSDSTIVPEPDPVNITVDKPSDLNSAAASPVDPVIDKPPDPVPAADPVKPPDSKDPVVDNLPAEPVKPAAAADNDVPMIESKTVPAKTVSSKPRVSKSSRPLMSANMFCNHVSRVFGPLDFPELNASGKEWDSKAKAYLRAQVKAAFTCKDIAVTNSDLRSWQETDVCDVSNYLSKMLSVHQVHLSEFVLGVVKSFWNSAKKSSQAASK
ncbi:PREDICTED: uncharacterized protein LOC107329969 [Acropora digitifera]|uniref:uncharacterized protein LOC107329969 n=1 Tax=Acropora digitifera TaxID=70779 RepID=UPI00077AFE30|nr:PREDICTED: uncharacterized protein LOC107329969 [Acropora digitifera]